MTDERPAPHERDFARNVRVVLGVASPAAQRAAAEVLPLLEGEG